MKNWTDKTAARNIALIYASSIFGNLDFSRGIFVLFLLSKGLSYGQIGIFQTVLFCSSLLAEVPAGMFADSCKRKYSVAAGLFLTAIVAFAFLRGQSFWFLLVLFALHGIGFAFRSGADQALLFDGLKYAGPRWEDQYLKISGRVKSLSSISLGAAMALGGFLRGWGWSAVYLCFAVGMAISAVCICLVQEKAVTTVPQVSADQRVSVFQNLKNFISTSQGRSLFWLTAGLGFIEATHTPFFIYGQILFKEYKFHESTIGFIIAASMAMNSVVYLFVDKFKNFTIQKLIFGISALTAVLISTFYFGPGRWLAVILFLAIEMLPSLLFVFTDNYIHEQVPSAIRASMLSLHSFISAFFISIVFLVTGALLDRAPAMLALSSLGVLPLVGMFFLNLYFRKKSRKIAVQWA